MLLAIDTSGAETSVTVASLASNTKIERDLKLVSNFQNLSSSSAPTSKSHSSSLYHQVERALRDSDCSFENLKAVILGAGPGSFTGLRIGFAFAKGLAISRSIPVFTFSSLAAAAWSFKREEKTILALDDARREEFYASSYSASSNGLENILPDQIITKAQVLNWLNDNPAGLLVSANQEVSKYFPQVFLASNISVGLVEQAIEQQRLGKLRRLDIATGNYSGEHVSELAKLTPVYLRKVAAMTIAERTSIPSKNSA